MGGLHKSISRPAITFVLIAWSVSCTDQVTKYHAVSQLTRAFTSVVDRPSLTGRVWRFLWHRHPPRGSAATVLDDFWHFRYVENPGASWSFLRNASSWRTPFLLLVSLAAMVFVVTYFRRTETHQRLLRVALALVFGGAIGNFLDRVRLGYVIDFIDWHWYDQATFPTFNLADSAITLGASLLILDALRHARAAAREPSR